MPPALSYLEPRTPVRVTYLIGSLEIGGAEGQVMELVRHLDRRVFEPSLILFEDSTLRRAEAACSRVFCLEVPREKPITYRPRGYRAIRAAMRLCSYLRETRPDILHAFLPASCIFAAFARMFTRVPYIIGSRRSLVECYRSSSRLNAIADRIATGYLQFMIGNSAAVTRQLVELDGCKSARTATIYNGVDTSRFSCEDRSMRKEMGWAPQDVVFGMVANFYPYKRHIDFVRAAALIHKKFVHTRFALAGGDQGALASVKSEIKKLGLEQCISIFPPGISVEKLLAAIDVYVCPSETEGFSNILLEAMASGKPVIATNVGGNPEAVLEGETGFIVPCYSPESIAAAAERFLLDPHLMARMSREGQARVARLFPLSAMVKAHEDLYLHLLQEPRCAAGFSAVRAIASCFNHIPP